LLGRGKVPDQRFCSSVLGDLPGWSAFGLVFFCCEDGKGGHSLWLILRALCLGLAWPIV